MPELSVPSRFVGHRSKNSEHIHPQSLRGLKHFQEDYPEAKLILLYRGRERMMKDNILCISCEEFLKNLLPDQVIVK
ncbi:MAG: hypothetical protein AB7F64_10105 [Gammaproteobacteria bacterium]